WLPLGANYKEVNVATQLKDPRSTLNFYRKLLSLSKSSPALQWGSYRSLDLQPVEAQQDCFVFERQAEGQRLLVALNFSAREQTLNLPGLGKGQILLSTGLDREEQVDLNNLVLRANEGCVIEL
ncbi:DUF3459 domain-containing protein, partial [bacterium]